MEDHRIALPYGALLPLSAKEHIQIKEEIGRGASCLVYDAVYQDSIGIPHTIRLKECYPVSLAVSRNSEGDLTVEKEEEERGEEGEGREKELTLEEYRTGLSKLGLTKMETEVSLLVIQGMSNAEIAQELYISETTVKKHLSNIFSKLEISSREEIRQKVWEGRVTE